jgi:putative endonuclease
VRAKDALGAYGEHMAERHLVESGLTILARNWRCELGEIDIVARDGDVLVICEVKTRSGLEFGTPLEGVTPVKAARLRRLAARWVATHAARPAEIRIDLVGVLRPSRGAAVVEHVRGAV